MNREIKVGRQIRIPIECDGKLKKFAFLTFLEDNSISFGFSQKFFASEFITAKDPDHIFITSNKLNANKNLNLESKLGKEKITNPHITFHPPNLVHITANKGANRIIYEGIYVLDLDDEVEHLGDFNWIQAISDPINSLDPFNEKPSRKFDILPINAPSGKFSVRLLIDFVKPNTLIPKGYRNHYIEKCGNKTLHIHCNFEPATEAKLMYAFHLGKLGKFYSNRSQPLTKYV